MTKIGNIFKLAEQQLINEGNDYSLVDIIEYAYTIRKWLDKKRNIKTLNKLADDLRKRKNVQAVLRYRLKKGV